MNISSISPIVPPKLDSIDPSPSSIGTKFSDVLGSAINQVESASNEASQSVERFLSGQGDDLHSTILSVQRADLEFDMAMQVRNKVVSAYQEVMRMQM